MHRKVQLIVSGGIRSGADVAKALALGADAVSIGTAALVAMGDNSPDYEEEYREDRQRRRLLRRLAGRPRPGRDLDAGRRARRALRPGRSAAAGRELPARAHARGADARPRVRQVARPQPRAGGPRRADGRGGGDGAGAARRDRLDPGTVRPGVESWGDSPCRRLDSVRMVSFRFGHNLRGPSCEEATWLISTVRLGRRPQGVGESRPRDELVGRVRDRAGGHRAHHRADRLRARRARRLRDRPLRRHHGDRRLPLLLPRGDGRDSGPNARAGFPSYAFETLQADRQQLLAAHRWPVVVGVLARLVHGRPDQRLPRLALHRRPLRHRLRRRVRADQHEKFGSVVPVDVFVVGVILLLVMFIPCWLGIRLGATFATVLGICTIMPLVLLVMLPFFKPGSIDVRQPRRLRSPPRRSGPECSFGARSWAGRSSTRGRCSRWRRRPATSASAASRSGTRRSRSRPRASSGSSSTSRCRSWCFAVLGTAGSTSDAGQRGLGSTTAILFNGYVDAIFGVSDVLDVVRRPDAHRRALPLGAQRDHGSVARPLPELPRRHPPEGVRLGEQAQGPVVRDAVQPGLLDRRAHASAQSLQIYVFSNMGYLFAVAISLIGYGIFQVTAKTRRGSCGCPGHSGRSG